MVAGRRSKKQINLETLQAQENIISESISLHRDKKPNSSEMSGGLMGPNFKEYVPDENHILEVRTISGNTFKNLFDTLKAVLNEANIVFTEKGLKLASIDTNKRALVHLFMDASSFEYYHCKEKLVLGLDIDLFQKTIKTNKMNDLMCLVVNKDERNILEVSFENFQKGTRVSDKINLLSLKEYTIEDAMEYTLPSEVDSQSFQNICREMSSFQATLLEIQSINDELIFKNIDGITRRTVVVRVTTNEDETSNKKKNPRENTRGVYQLRFLKSFAKAANLSPRVRIYLTKDLPLICEYSVSNLGVLRYVLSSEE